jgi:hypothetical protein
MSRRLALVAVAAMLALILWLIWWPATHPPPAASQGAPAPAVPGMTGPGALDGATAPSPARPIEAAPAPSSSGEDGAGPTNSFIVCPGNPRCPR